MKDLKVAPLDGTVPIPPPAAPRQTDLPAPAEDGRTGIARLGDPGAARSCAGCGRPVPQPAPGPDDQGLTGQVAWTWEMVDRLEGAADRLAAALMSELKDEAEAARAARIAAERDRDRIAAREGELLASLENARAELVALHRRLSDAETLAEGQRVEVHAAKRSAEDLRSAVRDAEAKRGQAVADCDQYQARAREYERHYWQLSRTADELRAAVRALTAERDARNAPRNTPGAGHGLPRAG
ncbi:hypothetical protein GCM10022254_51690 [Actinomadura meridiana]|uniref:Uncharacterized protein n=1 Tax=Actinomadura meridiana TaxID=559626 RepID=A0ABP8CDP4_9ACTN